MGCVHIYCGDGKGKTTAVTGMAVRMQGCGGQVVIARFLKTDGSGEVRGLKSLPGIQVIPCKKSFGFTWQMTEEQRREAAVYYEELLKKAFHMAQNVCRDEEMKKDWQERQNQSCFKEDFTGSPNQDCQVLLVLDEIFGAVESGLVMEESLLVFLKERPENLEVAMTGRNPSARVKAEADYVSEIVCIKHPFKSGTAARKGIEF